MSLLFKNDGTGVVQTQSETFFNVVYIKFIQMWDAFESNRKSVSKA